MMNVAGDRDAATADKARRAAEWAARMAEADRQWQVQRDQEAALLPLNKAALFEALAAGGVAMATVTFDGSGDAGQIEDVTAHGVSGQPRDLPDGPVEYKEVGFGAAEPTTSMVPVRDVLENLAYALLSQTHGGWEDGDGAHGEFTFDVATRSITLGFHERYTETTCHEHEF